METRWLLFGSLGVFIFIALVVGISVISPIYNVWEQRKKGEAELARAESNRRITILEALSKKEAASSLAETEVIRAKGVAEANRIIGDSLKNNEGYLRYLWIEGLQGGHQQTIYVTTEAGLPILEAGRFRQQ